MELTDYVYPFDLNGNKDSNLIKKEPNITSLVNGEDYNIIIPKMGPFHTHDIILKHVNSGRILKPFTDFSFAAPFKGLSDEYERATFAIIILHNKVLTGDWEVTYRPLGGGYTIDQDAILKDVANYAFNPRVIDYEDIAPDSIPKTFPPRPHTVSAQDDVYYNTDIIFALNKIAFAISGDLKPLHKHSIAQVEELSDELAARVDNKGNYKLGLTRPYYMEDHFGAIAVELPLGTVGLRVDIEVIVCSELGKGVISVGGIVTDEGNWLKTYALSEGAVPAQNAACGTNTNGHPYIWIGEDDTRWTGTNVTLSSVLLNSTSPEKLVDGWEFGVVEFPEAIVDKFPIKTGGMAGAGLVPVSRKVNGHALATDVNLTSRDINALGTDADGNVPKEVAFADNTSAKVIAKGLTESERDTLLMLLLDDTLEFGDRGKQTILNGMHGIAPSIRTTKGLKRILTEGDSTGEGGSPIDPDQIVPVSRKINKHTLDKDIELDANDVGALAIADGIVGETVTFSDKAKLQHLIGGRRLPIVDNVAVKAAPCTVYGNEVTRTVLLGSREKIPAILIDDKLYTIKVDGINDSALPVLNFDSGLTSLREDPQDDAVEVIQISRDIYDDMVYTLLGTPVESTKLISKGALKADIGDVKTLGFIHHKNFTLVGDDGNPTDAPFAPGKGLATLVRTELVDNVMTPIYRRYLYADISSVNVGNLEQQLNLFASTRPMVNTPSGSQELAYKSDVESSLGRVVAKDRNGSISNEGKVLSALDGLSYAVSPFYTSHGKDYVNEPIRDDELVMVATAATLVEGSTYSTKQTNEEGTVVTEPPSTQSGLSARVNSFKFDVVTNVLTLELDDNTFPPISQATTAVLRVTTNTDGSPVTHGFQMGVSESGTKLMAAYNQDVADAFALINTQGVTIKVEVGVSQVTGTYAPIFKAQRMLTTPEGFAQQVNWSLAIDDSGNLVVNGGVVGKTNTFVFGADGIFDSGQDVTIEI